MELFKLSRIIKKRLTIDVDGCTQGLLQEDLGCRVDLENMWKFDSIESLGFKNYSTLV